MVCGGEDNDSTAYPNWRARDSAEFYSPAYCVPGARPQITLAPTLIQYGSVNHRLKFTYTGNGGSYTANSLRVVLMRPGSVTHHFDAEQRYIELQVAGTKQTGTSTQVDFLGPDDQTMASKGYYMLFAVVDGWPSVASIVLVN